MKTCTKCGEEKPLEDFNKVKKDGDKRRAKCKRCELNRQNERRKERRRDDPDFRAKEIAQSRKWKIENRDKHNAYKRKYENDKYHNDPIHKLKSNYYTAINKALDGNVRGKAKFLGCTWEEFRIHLESQFTEGMNWDNKGRGGWHIDHRIPLAAAKKNKEKIIALCHYTNLQPMWEADNIRKLAKHCPKELAAFLEERKAAK